MGCNPTADEPGATNGAFARLTCFRFGWAKRADLAVLEVIRGDDRMPARQWLKLQPGDVLRLQGPVPVIGELLKSSDFQLKEEVKVDPRMLQSMALDPGAAGLSSGQGNRG